MFCERLNGKSRINILLVGLVTVGSMLLGCQKDKQAEIKNINDLQIGRGAKLEYYAEQGIITNPGNYTEIYQDLPSDVNELCKIVQSNVIHIFHAQRYGVELTEEKKKAVHIRKVEDMLEHIYQSDKRPIRFAREPEKRLVGNCRDFSVLLCSMLRHKNIPARARCGFATYFPADKIYVDHWICEYWNSDKQKWIQVDAQLDVVQLQQMNIKVAPHDLSPGQFLTAAMAWQKYKTGEENSEQFGIFDMKGMWFISGNVVRDFLALNKIEILPWDSTDLMFGPDEDVSNDKMATIDQLARLCSDPEKNFELVRSIYEQNEQFRMPSDWKP